MTSRRKVSTSTKGGIYNKLIKASKSTGVAAPPAPSTPTPSAQIPSTADVADSAIGVSGVKESNMQDIGVSGAKEEVGVGTTFSTISQTQPIFMKKFMPPRRMLKMPSWNSIVMYNTEHEPNPGTLFNTYTTYAEWYAGFAIAKMDDWLVYFGLVSKMALPALWPNGPTQAIAEAKEAGIHISAWGILAPGNAFFNWMLNTKVSPWIVAYLAEKYPQGIDVN